MVTLSIIFIVTKLRTPRLEVTNSYDQDTILHKECPNRIH
jgi:hypothetical protein